MLCFGGDITSRMARNAAFTQRIVGAPTPSSGAISVMRASRVNLPRSEVRLLLGKSLTLSGRRLSPGTNSRPSPVRVQSGTRDLATRGGQNPVFTSNIGAVSTTLLNQA